jgi:hypothetical protein
MKFSAVTTEGRTAIFGWVIFLSCSTTITAQKTCDCGDPPQGTVTCENTQEPFCIVKNGKVDARCESSSGKSGATLQRYVLERAVGRSLTDEEWKNAELQAGLAKGQALVKDAKGYDVLVKMRSTSDFEKAPTFDPYRNHFWPSGPSSVVAAFAANPYGFRTARMFDSYDYGAVFPNSFNMTYLSDPWIRALTYKRSFGAMGNPAPWWWDDSLFGLRCTVCVYRAIDGMVCQSFSGKTKAEVKAETEKMCRGDFLCSSTQPTLRCR